MPEFDNKTHTTRLLTKEAIDVINRHAETTKKEKSKSPMFLYLAYNAPHDPLLTDSIYDDKCRHIPNRFV